MCSLYVCVTDFVELIFVGFFQSAFPLWSFYLWFFPWRVLGSIPPKLCSLLSVLPQLNFCVQNIVHVSVSSCVCMDIMCTVCVKVYDVCVGVNVCAGVFMFLWYVRACIIPISCLTCCTASTNNVVMWLYCMMRDA